ncbi:MAG: tetratricopeptide repeat protein [Anaerolineae bacterium]|nr:tetratricopeptide repeat protein [Anaerolineae bacterium]
MHRLFRFILLTLLLTMGVAALAQDETSMSSEMEIPAVRRLEGLTMIHQDTNRCSASALTMQLSYFSEFNQTYRDIIARLNPYGGDVSVRIEEMAAVAQEYGLGAVVRRGGTIELLTRLIAAEFPVLIENVYYDGADGWQDWMSHNRVLMGYDDLQQQLYFFDPLLGNGPDGRGRSMTYAEVEQRWRPFNRDYLVIYKMEDEPLLQTVLGEQWDPQFNAIWTLSQAQAELDGPTPDSFALFNRGWAYLQLEEYEQAAASFDEAIGVGLPWRMMWYEFGPFEAYLAMGRYDDVINLVYQTLQTTDGVEEMYYYIAQAYAGKGDIDRAIANLEAALYRNRYYTEASDLMAELVAARNGETSS